MCSILQMWFVLTDWITTANLCHGGFGCESRIFVSMSTFTHSNTMTDKPKDAPKVDAPKADAPKKDGKQKDKKK